MAAGIMWPPIADAQLLPCEPQLASAGGTAWTCPLGGVRNVVDIEGGTEHYEGGVLDRPKLDLNISSGEAVDDQTGELVRSRLALNPDVGGPGTVIFDGRRNRIASFYPGDIRFYSAPRVCAPDCVPLGGQAVFRESVRFTRLRNRVERLERRVARLRSVVRRMLDRLR